MGDWWGISDWLTPLGLGLATFIGVVTLILEVLDIIFILTPTDKDDIWLAKTRVKWEKVKPYLEWLHVKTPLAKILAKVVAGLKLIKGIVVRYKKPPEE